MSDGLLQTKEALAELGDRLSACPMVAQYGAEEPGALLLAFSDLEGSFRVFLDEQLPKLADPTVQGEALEDLLMDIREEFRHILYHLHDPEFFRVVEPTHDWLTLAETAKK
jgi:hypothetical protein